MCQLRVQDRRTQVAEQTQLRTDSQQTFFRTDLEVRVGIPFRATHCTQQDRIRSLSRFKCCFRQWYAICIDSRTTHQCFAQLQPQVILFVNQFQYTAGLSNNFRANAVTRQNQYIVRHYLIPYIR